MGSMNTTVVTFFRGMKDLCKNSSFPERVALAMGMRATFPDVARLIENLPADTALRAVKAAYSGMERLLYTSVAEFILDVEQMKIVYNSVGASYPSYQSTPLFKRLDATFEQGLLAHLDSAINVLEHCRINKMNDPWMEALPQSRAR